MSTIVCTHPCQRCVQDLDKPLPYQRSLQSCQFKPLRCLKLTVIEVVIVVNPVSESVVEVAEVTQHSSPFVCSYNIVNVSLKNNFWKMLLHMKMRFSREKNLHYETYTKLFSTAPAVIWPYSRQ